MNVNITFSREELKLVLADVRKHLQHTQTHYTSTPEGSIKNSWVHKVGKDHWEFNFGPFYWHGSADNAYEARSKGWTGWLRVQGADGYAISRRTSQNRRVWEERPPARAALARKAWDWFTKDKCAPKDMWFHSFDGREMWVAEFPDGETDEIEATIIRWKILKEREVVIRMVTRQGRVS